MTLDSPLSVKVDEWRRIVLERPLTVAEMKEILTVLREGRAKAATTSAKARASKAPVDVSDLENEIDSL